MAYSSKDLKNYLKDLVKGKTTITNFSFEYRSGNTSFHTRLRILVTAEKIEHRRIPRGIEVDSREEKKATKVNETDFSEDKLKSFAEVLLKKKIWDLENCTDRALPDTARLTFTILDNGNPIFSQEIWESCRNDDTRAKELIRAISAIIPRNWSPP